MLRGVLVGTKRTIILATGTSRDACSQNVPKCFCSQSCTQLGELSALPRSPSWVWGNFVAGREGSGQGEEGHGWEGRGGEINGKGAREGRRELA